jgi:hypothetical protein
MSSHHYSPFILVSTVDPLLLKQPPLVCPLGKFIWEPFNWPEHALSSPNDADFGKQDAMIEDNNCKIDTNL